MFSPIPVLCSLVVAASVQAWTPNAAARLQPHPRSLASATVTLNKTVVTGISQTFNGIGVDFFGGAAHFLFSRRSEL